LPLMRILPKHGARGNHVMVRPEAKPMTCCVLQRHSHQQGGASSHAAVVAHQFGIQPFVVLRR
jgi:hypothetical protein